MVAVSLQSGKVVFVSFEESMDENFMQELMLRDDGYEIDNPFDPKIEKMRDPKIWELPEVPEDLPEVRVKEIKKELGKD